MGVESCGPAPWEIRSRSGEGGKVDSRPKALVQSLEALKTRDGELHQGQAIPDTDIKWMGRKAVIKLRNLKEGGDGVGICFDGEEGYKQHILFLRSIVFGPCVPRMIRKSDMGTWVIIKPFQSVNMHIKASQDERLHEYNVLMLIAHISQLLEKLHSKNLLAVDISPENLIYAACGSNKEKWTLLDMSNTCTIGESVCVDSLPRFTAPPELAEPILGDTEKVTLERGWDIWQLGMTAYELLTWRSYWDPEKYPTHTDAVNAMKRNEFPHIFNPYKTGDLQDSEEDIHNNLLMKLLDPNPAQRITAREVHQVVSNVQRSRTLAE